MNRKNLNRLVVVGGAHGTTPGLHPTSGTLPMHGLFDRLLRALRPAPRTVRAVDDAAGAAAPAPLYERHFANEAEAQAFAADLVRRGTRAEVVHDLYDYSWSVEVYGPDERLPGHDA